MGIKIVGREPSKRLRFNDFVMLEGRTHSLLRLEQNQRRVNCAVRRLLCRDDEDWGEKERCDEYPGTSVSGRRVPRANSPAVRANARASHAMPGRRIALDLRGTLARCGVPAKYPRSGRPDWRV